MSVPKKTTVWLYTCAKQPEQDDAIERMKREVEKQGLTVIGISALITNFHLPQSTLLMLI